VKLDDDASDLHTVVEAQGRNRSGLMCDLAAVIAQAGLSVASAHIETRGERVLDVFYVNEPGGGAVKDPRARAALVESLLAVLRSGEADAQEALAKRGMRRAPSSAVR
jgi:[protein-PII] uridylyltransferase